jgi:hypothetical protein
MKKLFIAIMVVASLSGCAATQPTSEERNQIQKILPSNEGKIVAVAPQGNLFRNAASIAAGMRMACPLGIICTNAVLGNFVVTDVSLLFIENGRIVQRVKRERVKEIEKESLGLSRGFRVTQDDYQSFIVTFGGIDSPELQNEFAQILDTFMSSK